MRRLLFLPLVMLFWPALAHAGTWCVPDASVLANCPNTAPTLQLAVNQATSGSQIFVGPDVPPGRTKVTKRVSIRCLNGAVLTDTGLAPSSTEPVVHFVGPITRPEMHTCGIDVERSAGAILLDPTAGFAVLQGLTLRGRSLVRPQYGLRSYDNPRLFFLGKAGKGATQPLIEGFEIGLDSRNNGWLDVEAASTGGVLFRSNGTGLRSIHDRGQIFFDIFESNGVGLELRGNFHMDANALTFRNNGVGMIWGLATVPNPDSGCTSQKTIEHNHAIYLENDIHVLVETSPGVYTEDYREDPGAGTQWTDMRWDGVLQPYFGTGFRDSVCQP